jgi:hypothetical protein
MAITPLQMSEFVKACSERKLTPTTFELRQFHVRLETTPVLNKNGRATGRTTTTTVNENLIFTVNDRKLVQIVKDAIAAPRVDYKRVNPVAGMVGNMLNPQTATGRKLADKGFTGEATVWVALDGFVGHMNLTELFVKTQDAKAVELALHGRTDDAKRVDFRASGIRGDETTTSDGIEFIDASN